VTFRCFPDDPNLIRRPDIAFVAADRAATIPPQGHVRIAPDLAIEVISPTNTINVFEEKLSDYRSADVKLVWEVNPTLRYVRIHRPNRTTLLLEEDEILSGEGVLPGFSVKVAELFPAS
jgi:Uma2 family endonuclease